MQGWGRVLLSVAVLAVMFTAPSMAIAEMTPPPCQVEPMSDGCAGPPTSGGTTVGRTFLTTDDVVSMGPTMMTLHYTPSEWDSVVDFYLAAQTYWDLYAPIDRVCSFAGADACTSATMADLSTTNVSFTPEP